MKFWTFGCSFTRYYWPTWADILVWSNPDLEVINMATPGIGNPRTYWRMQEAKLKGLIHENDTVVAVWSSWHREDRLLRNIWTSGNVFNSGQYCDIFLNKYWDEHLDIIRNASAIISANQLCNISHNGSMIAVGKREEYASSNVPVTLDYREHFDKYPHYIQNLPQMVEFDHRKSNYFNHKCYDRHPDVLCHHDYYNKVRNSMPWLLPADLEYSKYVQNELTSVLTPDLKHRKLYTVIMNKMEQLRPGWTTYIGQKNNQWTCPVKGMVC